MDVTFLSLKLCWPWIMWHVLGSCDLVTSWGPGVACCASWYRLHPSGPVLDLGCVLLLDGLGWLAGAKIDQEQPDYSVCLVFCFS